MKFNNLIKEFKKAGFNVVKQKSSSVYQIIGVANLDAITISESVFDYRISFWQGNNNVQTAMKTPQDIFNCVTSLTF